MTIVRHPFEITSPDLFLDLKGLFGRALYLKMEGHNAAGSIKLRTALALVQHAERSGRLVPGSTIIESSSGNLGVALGVIAAGKGYRFVCVTDVRCNRSTLNLLRALGAEVILIKDPDPVQGYLLARLDYVRSRCAADPRLVWLNQYENAANRLAHYEGTAPAIAKAVPDLDVLFVGVGTGGTAMGCAQYFREHQPWVRVVAVDAEGSVTFGGPPGSRFIPGLGAGLTPPLVDRAMFDDIVHVSERDSVGCCRRLAARGLLTGGSTGTVVSGALSWLENADPDRELVSVTISPDLADRYADTVYDDAWVEQLPDLKAPL
ncbi:2,3-diaminopropionate biosynthesis protein SbnA [Nonomuraea sp. NPDC005692]|uniref:2,3-diaminopropionate biosynthesis protein SbnA n=1 Tax=Nonomuraea sp. NPDC005692 TaxID=3157168 RepID=UPI0033C08B07